MRLTRPWRVLLLALVPIFLSGCGLLIPSLYGFAPTGSDPYPIPSMPIFSEDVTFTTGTASLELTTGATKSTVALDELVDGSQAYGMTTTSWRSTDGWSLRLDAFTMDDLSYGGYNQVTIQRINGTELWTADTTYNPSACTVVVHELTDKHLQGNATCRNLRWADALSANNMSLNPPKYIEGQAPFSVDITFEASAKSGQTS